MPEFDFTNDESTIEDTIVWDKQKILSKVGQEEIFEKYLGRPVTYRGLFRSPIRKDDSPTCSFTWRNGKLLYRDWSEPRAKDCFNIVEDLHNVDFYTALEIVAKDFNLTNAKPRNGITTSSNISVENYQREKNNEKSIIHVKRQPLTQSDVDYLKQYHLTKKIIDYYNVYSIRQAWLNGRLFYTYSKDKPALGYYFGQDEEGRQKWKLYFYRTRNSWRFIGNTNRINGWVQLPEKGKLLVITKSLKDVMCLARFGIPSIAMQAETQIPYDYIIDELKERFDVIYTLLDYDRPGIHSAWKIKKLYDIPAMFFNDRFEAKDFSDYLKDNGIKKTKELILEALDYIQVDPKHIKLPQ